MQRTALKLTLAGTAIVLTGCNARFQTTQAPSNITPVYSPTAHREAMFAAERSAQAAQIEPMIDVLGQSYPTEFDRYGVSVDAANLSQVTFTHEGADFDPSTTPDGKTMIFSSTQHRPTADIYSRPIDSHVVTQLTAHPANDVMPSVSPDGDRIVFASDRNGNWDLFIMPIEGGKAVQVTYEAAHELHATWSPDGQKLCFSRLGQMSGRWELWVIDLNNTGIAHHIGYGLFPEWCPTGGTGRNESDKIVFQRASERGERAFSIWTLDYKDGRSDSNTQIAYSNYAALINPAWSPDGQNVVFASVPNPSVWPDYTTSPPTHAALHLVSIKGDSLVTLTTGGSVDLMPYWGDDERIYYTSNRNGAENIWSIGAAEAVYAAAMMRGTHDSGFATVPEPENDGN